MDRATLPKLSAADRARLNKAIMTFRPRFLAFTSKTAGQKFFAGKRDYGEQRDMIGDTRVWILPSTSGAANGSWQPEVWHRFAAAVRAEAVGWAEEP
jgi:double-stranded uracil-DNA glycosylase